VVEDSVALTFSQQKYRLETGIPRILQYTAVLGITGRLEASLHSFSPRKVAYALGNVDPVNTVATIYAAGNTPGVDWYTAVDFATAPGGLKVGDVVVAAATSPGLVTSDNEAEVSSFGVGVNTLTVYFTSPGFPTQIGTGWSLAKVLMVAQPLGSSKQKSYHVIGVADTIDGYQVVHDMQMARVADGDQQHAFRPTENARAMLRFDLLGYSVSRYAPDSELVVAERFWFGKE
jgi:hypothetical protein